MIEPPIKDIAIKEHGFYSYHYSDDQFLNWRQWYLLFKRWDDAWERINREYEIIEYIMSASEKFWKK